MGLYGRLILASRSPRRIELLKNLGLEIEVRPSDFSEKHDPHINPAENTLKNAKGKVASVIGRMSYPYEHGWVLGADTVVVADGEIMGKPSDEKDARRMLKILSGRVHYVYSAFYLLNTANECSYGKSVRSEVKFRKLKEEEIEWYIETGEPMDKAGAYGVQGLGSIFIEEIRGSYTNVVGLPICELVEAMLRLGAVRLRAEL